MTCPFIAATKEEIKRLKTFSRYNLYNNFYIVCIKDNYNPE